MDQQNRGFTFWAQRIFMAIVSGVFLGVAFAMLFMVVYAGMVSA